jgi:hypothetical protein
VSGYVALVEKLARNACPYAIAPSKMQVDQPHGGGSMPLQHP